MIFLIGMPASGKSYWGKKIAEELKLPLADLDELIAQQEGNIAEIFHNKGEAYFRQKEREVLTKVIESYPPDTVVACGGGTPVYHNNLATMKIKGCVVYLDTELEMLAERLRENDTRPLLTDSTDKRERLQEILNQRKEIYLQADYILNAEELSVATFAKIIQECTDRH